MIPVEVLLNAYAQGIFPMAEAGRIVWVEPRMRGLIPLDERFHISKSLRKSMKQKPFEVRFNSSFREVVLACADRESTWIDEVILESYCKLHEAGFAHSVECWDEEGLQGGLYGVAFGKVFCGESMFSKKTNASKIALVVLVERLREKGFEILDTQWMTDHLKQFGGFELPQEEYVELLSGFF